MVGEGGGCCVGSRNVTTTCFQSRVGSKLAWPLSTFFTKIDWVSLDWFGQFTASQPFQCLIVSIMNGFASLRFEFIIRKPSPRPGFWVAGGNNFHSSTQHFTPRLCVLDWLKNITASQPFQLLIISIMNGWRRLRLVCGCKDGRHIVFWGRGWG